MASLNELARFHTPLDGRAVSHLQRLVAGWGLLADFCFADLLLFAPTNDATDGERFVILGQVRPSTSQTVYRADWIGTITTEEERPLVSRAYRLGEIIEGENTIAALKERVRVLCIPVRCRGEVVGVLTRESTPSFGRQPGELERTYVEVFNRFARMIVSGTYPFDAQDAETEEAPRVGDGVILIDASGRVEYTSPNGVSALHRIGSHGNAEGLSFAELGLDDSVIRTAYSIAAPVTEEVERGPEVTVLVRCIPLLDHGAVSGAVVLTRDISELRRRDRLLLSKDATIREIHHRVKNNLQTISSLLRLQGRRFSSPEAKVAIEESVRRIRSIALVHETLSRGAGDDVAFIEIVRPLVRMVEEGMSSPDHPVTFKVEGDAGVLPATVATPLSVVLNELLQNAIDHAFPADLDLQATPGSVVVHLDNDGERLRATVVDDGVGLPDGFALEDATGLGLSIVRTLVESELTGGITLALGSGEGGRPGTEVRLDVPVAARE
ncbi:MAG: histidine kinase N-terminal domain-containing protein [Acidimicrobiales bacterium]|nr:histidine kinase N-terminal domain-containing protein [Acidimicrobiales bacterium]